MALDTNSVNRIFGAARARDISKVEELWIALQSHEGAVEELQTFLNIAQEVAGRGDKDKAAELLLLLKDDLAKAGKHDELFELLRTAVRYSHRVRDVRGELVTQYRRKYGERPGLEAILSRVDLAGEGRVDEAVAQLDQAFYFQEGDYVFHGRGWGIGRVVECHPEVGEFVIDFARRRGQRMEAGMAMSALERRTEDDLDVLLWTDKDSVRAMAEADALALLKAALNASGGKLQARDLKSKLADVLDKSGWTKFWSKARKLAKDDPTIEVGPAPRSVISFRSEPLSRTDEVEQAIERAHEFTDRLAIARRELNAERSGGGEPPSWLAKALELLTQNHGKKGTDAQRAAQIELTLFRLEVVAQWPKLLPELEAVDPDTGEPRQAHEVPAVIAAFDGLVGDALPPVLAAISIAEYRRQAIRLAAKLLGEQASAALSAVLLDPAPQSWETASAELEAIGRLDLVEHAVEQVLIRPHDYPEALAALTRARLANGKKEVAAGRSDSELLVKALQVFDQVNLQFKGTQDRRRKMSLKPTVEALRSLISEKNQRVLKNVIGEGTEGDVRRVLQIVRQSPTLTPTIKRSTEKFVALRFPELLATVATTRRGDDREDDVLYSTAEGVRRRERELTEIMEVKMPEITVEIGKALEFGDISENAELDAARERQQRLAEQAKRIQDDLERVRVIQLENVDTDEVRIGTRVVVENLEAHEEETYSILGPWDLDEEDPSIISHLSALAVGLLGSRVGAEVTVQLPTGDTAKYLVKAIERVVLQET